MIVNPVEKLWRCVVEYHDAHGQPSTLWSTLLNRQEARELARQYQTCGYHADAFVDQYAAAEYLKDEKDNMWEKEDIVSFA
jgi:hypothetical protein